jgi:hypothetical protein
LEILEADPEILACAWLPPTRERSIEIRLRGLLQTDRRHTQHRLAQVGLLERGLVQGEPGKVTESVTASLESATGAGSPELTRLYELRAVANYRQGLYAAAAQDIERAMGSADAKTRERLAHDLPFVQKAGLRTGSSRGAAMEAAEGTEASPGASAEVQRAPIPFRLTAPDLGECAVSVLADFNGWNPLTGEMKLADGAWTLDVRLPPGSYRYYYLVNGWQRRVDPTAPNVEREQGISYWSVCSVTE